MRADALASALVALVATATPPARASKHHTHEAAPHAVGDPRPLLSEQLAGESASVAQASATVREKLAALDAARNRRLAAITRVLHDPLPLGASSEDRMAFARRRAAARLLVHRDANERGLLADELSRLTAADARVSKDAAQVAALQPPPRLVWPAQGTIAHDFGPVQHEATHATLSRRGLDLDVDDRAAVIAPSDGIVRYAGPLLGLDHGVVLDCDPYWLVLGKLGEALPPTGTHVARGARIGRAAHHRVYFEVRAKLGPGGLPLDPKPLLAP